MDSYEVTGNVVMHSEWPRFRLVFQPCAGGGWEAGREIEWIDNPKARGPVDAQQLARLMREAGEAFAADFDRRGG